MEVSINEVLKKCEQYIVKKEFKSYDLFDALTNNYINRVTKNKRLLRRIVIQIVRKSPIDLHWLGMKKMLHTKTISDLICYYSTSGKESRPEVNHFFELLIQKKSTNGYGWGLNFPYTSRFVDAGADTPNLYNTSNAGIAICYSFPYLSEKNKLIAKEAINGIIRLIETELGWVDEIGKGWYSYYPHQKYPVYNVNALTVYFLSFVRGMGFYDLNFLDKRIRAVINLLSEEQEHDGSWFYSRSDKGKWIDGFHTGFIVESLAFAYKVLPERALEEMLRKGWVFYIDKMFTEEGYPKYYLESGKYPIESQNCAQAIQTLANVGMWLTWEEKNLLDKIIKVSITNLFDKKGYFFCQKTKYFTNRRPYIRWSITPMMLALACAMHYTEHKN